MGCLEEGNLVVAASPPLRLDHPSEQRTLSGGPVLRQQGRAFGPVGFSYGLKPVPFKAPPSGMAMVGLGAMPQAGIGRVFGPLSWWWVWISLWVWRLVAS